MTDTPKCPFCSGTELTDRYVFDNCKILLCAGCGLMLLHPRPTISMLKSVYGDDYFANNDFLSGDIKGLYGYVDYIGERINKQYEYVRIVDEVRKCLSNAPGESKPGWLDVGCGLGFLLDVAFDKEFAVHGIEFNSHAVNYIRSKYTYPVHGGTIQDFPISHKFDVVSMMDVVEHLYDPFTDLKRVREMLSPQGVLVLSTMDSGSIVSQLLGKQIEDFRRIREHLFFFTRATITSILEDSGFAVERIGYLGHTFRVRMLLDRLSLTMPRVSRLARWLIRPKWLLEANVYVNPGTKMLVVARPS